MIRKIAITGPESTGKSLLAEKLARHYRTVWNPEYSRVYLDKLDHPYQETDILRIAKGQIREECRKEKQASGYLFCDTELIVTKIWSEVKYKRCHPWILRMIEKHRYDLFLLCDIDLPWEPDPLREHPDKRDFLFNLYYKELTDRKFPFYVVTGTGNTRTVNTISFIDHYFQHIS